MRPSRAWLGWVVPLSALVAWQCLMRAGPAEGGTLVPPSAVLARAGALWSDGSLREALLASAGRYLAGLSIGAAAGVGCGIALGVSRLARALFGPTLRTLQQITLFAWIPLIMAWFGLGEPSKVVFIALAAFFPAMVNTFEGVGSIAPALVEVGRVFRFGRGQMLAHVVLPSALPSIFTGLHLAVIYAWLATLGAEYLLTTGNGLGNLLVEGQELFQTDEVLVGIVLVAAIGFLAGWLVERLQAHWLRWKTAP